MEIRLYQINEGLKLSYNLIGIMVRIFILTIDTNLCRGFGPCQNGATCTYTGVFTYTCTCVTGYTGTDCDQGEIIHHKIGNLFSNYRCQKNRTIFYFSRTLTKTQQLYFIDI